MEWGGSERVNITGATLQVEQAIALAAEEMVMVRQVGALVEDEIPIEGYLMNATL